MDETPQTEDALRAKAEEMVEAKIGFKRHLMVYLVINGFLFAIWLITALISGGGAWFPWFVFVIVGWGIGVFMHGWRVYYGQDEAKREKQINIEMERMRDAQGGSSGTPTEETAAGKTPPTGQE